MAGDGSFKLQLPTVGYGLTAAMAGGGELRFDSGGGVRDGSHI